MDSNRARVRDNYARIRENIADAAQKAGRAPEEITLMAVTKTVDPVLVNEAIDCGVRLLGENRVQEYESKKDAYREGIPVDFIGTLQTNKVKYILGSVRMIHSVDRLSLAKEIDRLAARKNIVQEILLEVNIGGEETKSGAAPQDLPALLEAVHSLEHVRVQGLMTIPPPCKDTSHLQAMQELFLRTKETNEREMRVLSMGMSDDYPQAIACGSNLVRIGTALFGARVYPST